MKWLSTKKVWPGNQYKPESGYETPEFIIIYHHGDDELMTNLAFWDGTKFVIGTTCYCDSCDCDCNYQKDYSDECEVTHWCLLEIPNIDMERYFEESNPS